MPNVISKPIYTIRFDMTQKKYILWEGILEGGRCIDDYHWWINHNGKIYDYTPSKGGLHGLKLNTKLGVNLDEPRFVEWTTINKDNRLTDFKLDRWIDNKEDNKEYDPETLWNIRIRSINKNNNYEPRKCAYNACAGLLNHVGGHLVLGSLAYKLIPNGHLEKMFGKGVWLSEWG